MRIRLEFSCPSSDGCMRRHLPLLINRFLHGRSSLQIAQVNESLFFAIAEKSVAVLRSSLFCCRCFPDRYSARTLFHPPQETSRSGVSLPWKAASSFPELLFQCPIRLRKAMPSVYTCSRAGDTGLVRFESIFTIDTA